MTAWKRIDKEGLILSKTQKRISPVGVPYDVQGGKIWLCDRPHLREFAEHLRRIKGKDAAQVLLRVWVHDDFIVKFRPLRGAYFVTFPIPRPFLKGSFDDVLEEG
jgi:hypothetical protein